MWAVMEVQTKSQCGTLHKLPTAEAYMAVAGSTWCTRFYISLHEFTLKVCTTALTNKDTSHGYQNTINDLKNTTPDKTNCVFQTTACMFDLYSPSAKLKGNGFYA